jgi:hypothetical protein
MKHLLHCLMISIAFAAVTRAQQTPDLEIQLNLFGAVFKTDVPQPGGPTLILDLARTGDRWERVWGDAPRFNKCLAEGLVSDSKVDADSMALTISLSIGSDAWVKGGRGRYVVELKRKSDSLFEGTYSGQFRNMPLNGVAQAIISPKRKPIPNVHAPVKPGEHPRLLFRQADVPALKAKAQTPFGQAALAKLNGVVGSALKYQLTGEKKYATDIIPEIEKMIADNNVGDKMVRGRVLGWRFEQVALAYDLCYDAWPESLRQKVEKVVAGYEGWRAFTKMWTFQKEIQWVPTGVYPGPIRYGPAMAVMAIWGEKGPMPVKPVPPFAVTQPDGLVSPATDFTKSENVPLSKFASGVVTKEWIALTGFKPEAGQDPLAGMGGFAKARPVAGQKVSFAGNEAEFRKLSDENKDFFGGGISITVAARRHYHTTAYFYTVVENNLPRWVRVNIGHGGVAFYLNGTRLMEGDMVRLDQGFYPIMVVAPVGETSSWGQEVFHPKLTAATEADAQKTIAQLREDYEAALQQWEFDVEQHKRLGGANVEALKLFEVSRRAMRIYFREAMGDGGYMGAPLNSLEGPNKYAVAHRNAFGADVSPYADATHFLARKTFTLAYGSNGPGTGWELGNTAGFISKRTYIEPQYDLAPNFFGQLFPLTPDPWKPSMLWAWQRHIGFSGKDDAAAALKEAVRPTNGYPGDPHVAWTFVNLPLGMPSTPPAGVLPLTWRADDHGWYGFRNQWKNQNDFVTQFYLRNGAPGGEDAGAFRVMGLGQRWGLGGSVMRLFENVVQLPDDETNLEGHGRLIHYEARPDGSGAVTIDLGDVYAAPSPGLYEPFGYVRVVGNFKPSGITGLRALAVDYSGKSGAPCLLVIVDKVTGAKSSVWSWPSKFDATVIGGMTKNPVTSSLITEGKAYGAYTQAEMKEMHERLKKAAAATAAKRKDNPKKDAPKKDEKNAEEESEDENVSGADDTTPVIASNTFTITKGGAVLKGTLVAPVQAPLGLEELEKYRMGAKHTLIRYSSEGVVARGDGEFMAIITIGTGEPPAVKTTGTGLTSKVTVGNRAVSFDGTRIIME